ncbi:hypothetical protein RQP54_18140 [Curvibacter sp. APW13]|uniref:hypothetical protein n=1 Tax=Curvibacter sp. APW13 TaxID=3077236 RepID=UPI0028DEB1CF|nr:hypothetical protein [Curvibacter sp. APW13]MDT8992799.1 hypothetical protein [Curvibacter sp. APW13]
MNRAEYLLVQAGSECNEIAHRASKALHFGLREVQPGQEASNAQRLVAEYIDLLAVMEMLEEDGLVHIPTGTELREQIAAKKAKVEKFIRFAAEQCGTVQLERCA